MRVLYTGAFRFPDGDAAAFRVHAVARLLRELGCAVTFAGWEAPAPSGPSYEYDGFECVAQGEFREVAVDPLRRVAGFLRRGTRTLEWIARQPTFDLIIAYNPPAWFAAQLLRLSRDVRTRVALDATEWYESAHLPGGAFGLAAAENWYRMTQVYPRFQHAICISTFLEVYLRGRNVVRIPPLLPTTTDAPVLAERPSTEAGIRLVYAGQAGRKDRLMTLIESLPEVQGAIGRPLTLTIAGMPWDELAATCASAGVDAERSRPQITCLGRVSRAAVASLYRQSHLSVLFREDKRYAKAGFPTKAMESWAAGCVILGNAVGDFGALASQGNDALLVDEQSLERTLPAMLRTLAEPGEFARMSRAAEATAARCFSPAAYLPAMSHFLDGIARAERRPSPVGSLRGTAA